MKPNSRRRTALLVFVFAIIGALVIWWAETHPREFSKSDWNDPVRSQRLKYRWKARNLVQEMIRSGKISTASDVTNFVGFPENGGGKMYGQWRYGIGGSLLSFSVDDYWLYVQINEEGKITCCFVGAD